MRLGFSTLGCAERDLESIAALAVDFGVADLELRALEDRMDLPVYLSERFGRPEVAARWLRDRGMRVPVLDTSLKLDKATPEARETLLTFVPWAEAMGTPFLRVFDGGKFGEVYAEETMAAAVEFITWWRARRKEAGWQVDLAVETHDSLCASQHCLTLQKALPTPVPLIWDTWHIWFKNQEPLEETWERIRPYVVHIHFKDGVREPILQYPYRYEVPGTGVFPLITLERILREDAYEGVVCLEWERKWHPYLAPIEEALTGSRRFFTL